MKVTVNNKTCDTQASTLLQLTKELSLPDQGVALAMNNHIIPRAQWGEVTLTEGATIVIIKAACGG